MKIFDIYNAPIYVLYFWKSELCVVAQKKKKKKKN